MERLIRSFVNQFSPSPSLSRSQGGYKDENANRLLSMSTFRKAQESLKCVTEDHRATEAKAKEVGYSSIALLSVHLFMFCRHHKDVMLYFSGGP